jgi:hypothetical protein
MPQRKNKYKEKYGHYLYSVATQGGVGLKVFDTIYIFRISETDIVVRYVNNRNQFDNILKFLL